MRDDTETDFMRTPEVTSALSAAINALREAPSENAKLLAIRTGAQALAPLGDIDALDHLSNVALDMYNIQPDVIQAALDAGVRLSEARSKSNGADETASAELCQKPASRFVPIAIDDVEVSAEPAWAIHQLLPARGLACAYGPPKCRKSFLMCDALLPSRAESRMPAGTCCKGRFSTAPAKCFRVQAAPGRDASTPRGRRAARPVFHGP
jgi:hypothetical protein